jgi:hypothetical protein
MPSTPRLVACTMRPGVVLGGLAQQLSAWATRRRSPRPAGQPFAAHGQAACVEQGSDDRVTLVVAAGRSAARARASPGPGRRASGRRRSRCVAAAAACRPARRRWRDLAGVTVPAAQHHGLRIGAAVGPFGEVQRQRAGGAGRASASALLSSTTPVQVVGPVLRARPLLQVSRRAGGQGGSSAVRSASIVQGGSSMVRLIRRRRWPCCGARHRPPRGRAACPAGARRRRSVRRRRRSAR